MQKQNSKITKEMTQEEMWQTLKSMEPTCKFYFLIFLFFVFKMLVHVLGMESETTWLFEKKKYTFYINY